MAGIKIVSMLLVCILVAAPMAADAAMNCVIVINLMKPCVDYLRGTKPLPPACCNGVRALNAQASNTRDRQIACGCLKSAAGSVNANLVGGLPGKCGVNIPYKITPSTDCAKIR